MPKFELTSDELFYIHLKLNSGESAIDLSESANEAFLDLKRRMDDLDRQCDI